MIGNNRLTDSWDWTLYPRIFVLQIRLTSQLGGILIVRTYSGLVFIRLFRLKTMTSINGHWQTNDSETLIYIWSKGIRVYVQAAWSIFHEVITQKPNVSYDPFVFPVSKRVSIYKMIHSTSHILPYLPYTTLPGPSQTGTSSVWGIEGN